MKRIVLAVAAVVALAAVAEAHFVCIVPTKDGKGVQVVFSDDLGPDKSVPISKVAGTKLTLRAGGKKYKEERHYATLVVDVPEAK